jgi:hypothetical protein
VKQRALDCIAAAAATFADARAVYDHQVAECPHYAAFSDGADPQDWHEIPAVPVGLFKEGLRFCVGEPARRFLTSGTTQGRRGAHHLVDLDAYEAAALAWWRARVPGCPTHVLSLCPDPAQAPESSLGHMVRLFADTYVPLFDLDTGLHPRTHQVLQDQTAPLFLACTAFSLAELLRQPVAPLPQESVVMVTGGFKGRTTALSSDQVLARARTLGLLVQEYGMTELSSQLWQVDGEPGFRPPPWMHVYTVDPLTGAPAPQGGLLRFVDLANWGSCLAIETEDLGVVQDGWVHLRGRLPAAPLRGCSLSAEEAGQWRL